MTKAKIKRVHWNGFDTVEVIAEIKEGVGGRSIVKIAGKDFYPMYSLSGEYFGYYHDAEIIEWIKEKTPTPEVNPEWGPVCP